MAHFTPAVEQFVSGTTGKNPMGDLVYTLRAWPNHHRALNTIIKVRLQSKDVYQGNKKYPPAECFLQRAIHFSPEDATTYMLYGMLLQRMDKLEEAHAQYLKARELSPQDIQIKYNYALLLIKLNRIVEAEELARDIYAANYPLPGLRRQLERAGVKL
jgi:Flp pilus assembly protein TadD